jgi:stage II sporulation protein M
MVFEQLFVSKWLEKKLYLSFLLGFVYAELGIISAILIFPEDPSLISIGFISLLILPSLNYLLSLETKEDMREKRFSLKAIFRDHWDIFVVYAFIFLGILLAFGILAVILPQGTTETLFGTQLDIYFANAGRATGPMTDWGTNIAGAAYNQSSLFWSILTNNLKVILVCFIFSLAYGAGSVLFLTWNASVWGTIFGFVARTTATVGGNLASFGHIMISVFPHMIAEASSYFLAVFAGGIISKAVIKERMDSKRFYHVLLDGIVIFGLALVILLLAAWLEVYIFPLL